MPSKITDDMLGQRLWQDAKAQAIGMAKLAGHGPDQKAYTPEDELLLWNTVADGWSVDKEEMLLASGKSREEIGLLKYPNRQKLAESGERFLSKYEQAKYADKMAKLADPTWQTPLPKGSQEPVASPLPAQGAAPPPPAPLMPAQEPQPSAGASSMPVPYGG